MIIQWNENIAYFAITNFSEIAFMNTTCLSHERQHFHCMHVEPGCGTILYPNTTTEEGLAAKELKHSQFNRSQTQQLSGNALSWLLAVQVSLSATAIHLDRIPER